MKRLLLVGLSHRTAPVEWRERLALPEEKVSGFLEGLRLRAGVEEAVLLSTCNRVEVYAVTPPEGGHEGLIRGEFVRFHGDPALDGSLYALEDEAAVRHLFHVAAGLDSLVIGEAEILGQVKSAYDAARRAQFTGKLTNVLFQRALFVGKLVRARTKISEGPTSVPSLAVSLAERIFGDLAVSRVLVVGAGAMAELAVRALKSQKVREIVIANRSLEKAVGMARRFGARPAPFSALPFHLTQADIVLCSTGSPEALFRQEDVVRCLRARRGRSLFFIDIAVPRDVEPGVNDLENVYLYNIDDLQGLVNDSLVRREEEMTQAGKILGDKAEEFARWYRSWRAGETAALRHGDAPGAFRAATDKTEPSL